MQIAIDRIRVGSRLRSVVAGKVEQLAESIAALGLQTPITVAEKVEYPSGQAQTVYLLIAGAHRLEAHKSLGLTEIEAAVSSLGEAERQLWEIDENLCRADLTELEQGEHLLKRKEIYEWWRPETKQHVAGAVAANAAMGNATDKLAAASFAADTAAKTGIDERSVRRSIRRAKEIDEKVRDRIRDNPEIADSGVELDALAALEPQQQRKAVALVESGQAAGIRDAKKLMEPKPPKVTPQFKEAEQARQKRRDAAIRAWNALDEEDRDWFMQQIDRPVADNTIALRAVT